MAVEAFIHFEKSTASMADVKGDSTDPAVQRLSRTEGFQLQRGEQGSHRLANVRCGRRKGPIQGVWSIQEESQWSSPFLFKNCAVGGHYKLVTLVLRRTGGDAPSGRRTVPGFQFWDRVLHTNRFCRTR